MDCILKPYATNAPSYIRDTADFLRKLQSTYDLPDNTILATVDAKSLYTNITDKHDYHFKNFSEGKVPKK